VYGDGEEALERTGRPVPTRTLHTRIVDRVDDLTAFYDEWDRLAVVNRAPYSTPAWCLAWWRHVAPESARLQVIIVHDGRQVIAVAPFYCIVQRLRPVRYMMLGASAAPRVTPLAEPGTERVAAAQIAAALVQARPRPAVIEFDGLPSDSSWPRLIDELWPKARSRVVETQAIAAPAITLHGNFEDWLSGKSRSFRKQARYQQRRLLERGATFRMPTQAADAVADLEDFRRLHEARWRYRGGSGVLDERLMNMLRELAASLTPSGRFRLWLIDHEGQVISAQVLLSAGGEVAYWLGGFDDAWGLMQPSMQGLIASIEHAFDAGDKRLDLGPGAQAYKLRLSDHEDRLVWTRLYPPSPMRPMVMASMLPNHLRLAVTRRAYEAISAERKNQIKRWLRRVRDG